MDSWPGANLKIASTYGGNGYGNSLYSADGTNSSTAPSNTSTGNSSGLVDTGSAAILITVVAVIILVATAVVTLRRSKKSL